MKRTLLLTTLFVCALASSAWATPFLQLYFDPALNAGAFYNPDTGEVGYNPAFDLESWCTAQNPAVLTTFMIRKCGKTALADSYRVVISLPGYPGNPATDGVSLTVADLDGGLGVLDTSSTNTWTFGNPGLEAHGVFDAWYTTFDFTFVSGNGATVFDVAEGGGEKCGYRDDFQVSFNASAKYHFDLLDVDTLYNAPFSHDAQANSGGGGGGGGSVPVPAPLLLLGSGVVGLVVARRKK